MVGLVLSCNFNDCDFSKIKRDYHHIIFNVLRSWVSEGIIACLKKNVILWTE